MNQPPFADFGRRIDASWATGKIARTLVCADDDLYRRWKPVVELFGLPCDDPHLDDDPWLNGRAADAIALYVLWSYPGAALAWTLNEWRHDTFGDGVLDTLMRTARAVLEAHDAPAGDEAVATLAVACRTHARAFLESIDGRLPSYATATGFASSVYDPKPTNDDRRLYGGGGDLPGPPDSFWSSPAGLTAWIRDLYGPHPAADLEQGAPWLSVRLADYLRTAFNAHEEADRWLELERERAAVLQPDLPGMPPRHAMPGWAIDLGVSSAYLTYPEGSPPRHGTPIWGTRHGTPNRGVSPAWFALAAVTWVARERTQQQRYPTSMMMLPFARAGAVANPAANGGGWWVVAAVDPTILERLEKSGALTTVESQALIRSLPDLARQAANAPGREVVVWSDGAAEVAVCMGNDHRTSVGIRGGWGAFAAALKLTGGSAQAALASAGRGFAALPFRWSATDIASGTTTIVMDLDERRADGRVRFALPRLLWPGFSTELGRTEREGKPRVPVDPTLPPSTNPKLAAGPSRMELAAVTWIRDHVDSIVDDLGAPVPWTDLAESVALSNAGQRSRREATLNHLLDLWRSECRWICTVDDTGRALWRPMFGWTGPGSLLEARKQVQDGRAIQARSKVRRKPGLKR
jgi:hypothetical protein